MFRMEPAALREALGKVERAGRVHTEWRDNLIRSLVCRLPADPAEFAAAAYRSCRFGHWYHDEASPELRERPAFAAMDEAHRAAHRIAARLLEQSARGGTVCREDYDAMTAACERLSVAIGTLHGEIEASLGRCDPLTGAHGRVELLPELSEWRDLARRNIESCSIVFMDVDHLKEINDRHGHAVGDRVLAGAVRYVGQNLRPYDKVFRYGGDEFVISLPGAGLQDALHLIERIRDGFGQVPFVTSADGQDIHATASFGVAALDPEACVEESIDRADKALLMAKAAGRDRVVSWEPSIATGTLLSWGGD